MYKVSLILLKLLTSLAVLCLMSTAQFAYGQANNADPIAEEKQMEPYNLAIDTDEAAIGSVEPIFLHLDVINMGKEDIVYGESDPERMFVITVKNSKGDVMPLTRYGKIVGENSTSTSRAFIIRRIISGDKANYKLLINRIYDMSVPDSYTINASFVIGIGSSIQGAKTSELSSNVLQIKVGGLNEMRSDKPNPKTQN